jgi:hypothetical protein
MKKQIKKIKLNDDEKYKLITSHLFENLNVLKNIQVKLKEVLK